MKIALGFALSAVAALAAALFWSDNRTGAQDATPNELTAARVKSVDFKAELTEGWKAAAPVTVSTAHKPGNPGPDVELRALHDGEHVYLMARWKDATKSDTKKAWVFKDGAWTKAEGDEDRLAVAFGGNTPGFAEKGCGVLCHNGEMRTLDKAHVGDLWHWKAARGGQHGECDDQSFAGGDKGRPDDAGKSAYETNAAKDGKSPTWIWHDDADVKGAFNVAASAEAGPDHKFDEGYTVPSVRLRAPEGSRGDIKAASNWHDGMWTIVLKRKLDTGNADDVQFKAGESAWFAVATMDNTGADKGHEHAKGRPIKLTLGK